MKPILIILAITLIAACGVNREKAAAKVCSPMANCCSGTKNASSTSKSTDYPSLFSPSTRELGTGLFTW